MVPRVTRSSSATPAKKKAARETIVISESDLEEITIREPAPKRAKTSKGKGKAVPVIIPSEEIAPEDAADPRSLLLRNVFVGPTLCPCSASLPAPTPTTLLTLDDKDNDFLARSVVKCDSKCGKFVCRGCAAYIELADAGSCCAAGRAIVIYEVSLHSAFIRESTGKLLILATSRYLLLSIVSISSMVD